MQFNNHWKRNQVKVSQAKLNEAERFLNTLWALIPTGKVLDVGCGDGVHGGLFQHKENIEYSGIDISSLAIGRAKNRLPKAHLSIANAQNLPYSENSFDVVFSYGVIAYTDDPKLSFTEIIRVCKPGGVVGLWVYPRSQGAKQFLFAFSRILANILGPFFSRFLIIYPIIILLPILPVYSGINLFNSSWKQCVEVVEVNLLPEKLVFFSQKEIGSLFHEADIEILYKDETIIYWGKKRHA